MIRAGIISYRKLPGKKGKTIFKIENFFFSVDKKNIRAVLEAKEKDISLVIFDVDDTLVRRNDIPKKLSTVGKNAIKEAKLLLREKGVSISLPPEELFNEDWIFSKYGNTIEWFISTWLNVSGVPNGELKESIVKKYVKEYYSNIEISAPCCSVFQDVKPFLETYKSSLNFAAMSNSSKKTIIETFRNNGILNYFIKKGEQLIIGGDEIPKSKETILEILKFAKVNPENTFLIGDSGMDIKVAREAGISPEKTIAIYRRITPLETLKSIKPRVRIVRSLKEIII